SACLRVGEDSAGVVASAGGDETRADDRQQHHQTAAPALGEKRHGPSVVMPKHGDHVVGRDDAGEPPVLVDNGEREEIVFVEQGGHFVLRRIWATSGGG